MRTLQRTQQAMKLPRYVQKKRSSYQYCRKLPSELFHLTPVKWFNYPLRVPHTASEAEISRAAAKATEAFELKCKTLTNSDPAAYRENELEALALDWLRARGLKKGGLERILIDPIVRRVEEQDQVQYQLDNHDVADAVIPELDDVEDKIRAGQTLTLHDQIVLRARRALTDALRRETITIGSLWADYAKQQGIEPTSREGKRREGNWRRWLSVCGEHFIDPKNPQVALYEVHRGLDEYVVKRESEVKGSSIKRELADVLACLRFGSRKFRLHWHIEPPTFRVDEARRRPVLSESEQKKLLKAALGASSQDAKVATCVILLQQGGLMVSEVSRLRTEDIRLSGRYPYVAITGKTKKDARRRIVPIVFGVDFLKKNIEETINWLGKVTETTPSAAIKKFIDAATGNDELSAHCLRHTWSQNARAAEAPDWVINDIGGWAGNRSISPDALKYGAAGIDESRRVKVLHGWNEKIFQFIKHR